MDTDVYRPNGRTTRFMSLTACNERQARFCLEASDFDFQKAAHMYRRDVMGVSFQERPPCREEQEKELDTGCSFTRVAGIVGGLAALSMVDGLFTHLTAGLVVAATMASLLHNSPEGIKEICTIFAARDGCPRTRRPWFGR